MKILMVDDVKFSIEMGRLALLDSGCEILTAMNGHEALELMKREQPDLVLTDLYMPGMNGDELCLRIKETPAFRHIPVVIVSSVNDGEIMEKCIAAGCSDILRKPYTKSGLIDMVNRHVNIICRKHERYPVDLEVIYNCEGRICTGKVVDLSEGGMFVKGDELLPQGAAGEFSLSPGHGDYNLEVKGEVARIVKGATGFTFDNMSGMGIRFIEPPPRIDSLLSGLARGK